jgi:hypothetical protein
LKSSLMPAYNCNKVYLVAKVVVKEGINTDFSLFELLAAFYYIRCADDICKLSLSFDFEPNPTRLMRSIYAGRSLQ